MENTNRRPLARLLALQATRYAFDAAVIVGTAQALVALVGDVWPGVHADTTFATGVNVALWTAAVGVRPLVQAIMLGVVRGLGFSAERSLTLYAQVLGAPKLAPLMHKAWRRGRTDTERKQLVRRVLNGYFNAR